MEETTCPLVSCTFTSGHERRKCPVQRLATVSTVSTDKKTTSLKQPRPLYDLLLSVLQS
ncbi:hypothetical protein EXN66_Car018830 [Channa argus]|uniref:Uncharacterized protein n=1 Tax=Channa argus TaxID=215402 RepID=A0A6G1QKR4_CHAAH|nr:hypothetical protein EXN66_Car018830 [Channa argus]